MAAKPQTAGGYDPQVTASCERVLVTLLRGLGPWKKSVYLVGGLTPRYLVDAKPPDVPAHAGTSDVDVVVELTMLAETEAYHSLEENFKKLGFQRAKNEKGQTLSWRWETQTNGVTIALELLADDPQASGGKVRVLPTKGKISAINIPHSSMVFDHHEAKEIRAELLGDNGVAVETIRYADIVSFVCLKGYAFDDRAEPKDAHDLVYCLENANGGMDAAVAKFKEARQGKHRKAIDEALGILAKHFASDGRTEGFQKNGPVAVAKFELREEADSRDARILRQRQASDVVERLLKSL